MIKAIAVDDEPLALTILEHYCTKNEAIHLERTFTSQKDALHFLEKHPIDVLFLDIQMPEMNGLSFYKSLNNKPLVVFTTAFDHYAVEGFNVNAIDYLLKPISQERFDKTIEKLVHLKKNLFTPLDEPSIFIKADYKLNKIFLKDILHIEGLDDYVQIFLKDKPKIVARMSMKNMTELLPDKNFIRIHRSYIVPISLISSVVSKAVFLNDKEFPIGDTYKKEVVKTLTSINTGLID